MEGLYIPIFFCHRRLREQRGQDERTGRPQIVTVEASKARIDPPVDIKHRTHRWPTGAERKGRTPPDQQSAPTLAWMLNRPWMDALIMTVNSVDGPRVLAASAPATDAGL